MITWSFFKEGIEKGLLNAGVIGSGTNKFYIVFSGYSNKIDCFSLNNTRIRIAVFKLRSWKNK